jgi:hypothetical protein
VDVDFDHAPVSPPIPRVVVDHQVQESAPKTERGRRRLALDPVTLQVLQEHRKRQAEDRQAVGRRYRDDGYVFTWPDGRPLHPDNIAHWFEQHTRAAGLPRIRLHDVRHSYATAALKARISARVISERLGHASVAFTLQTYGHVIPGMDRDAATTVADLILSMQKGPGTVVPDPSANNGPQSEARMKEVKGERPAQQWWRGRDLNPRPLGYEHLNTGVAWCRPISLHHNLAGTLALLGAVLSHLVPRRSPAFRLQVR